MIAAPPGLTASLDRPIVVVGLMGAGKSRIGAALAEALGLPFVDADREIERRAGMSISEIFERDGEAAFREMESAVIGEYLHGVPLVLAPGGGALMTPVTASLVAEKSLSVWLRADLDILVERTSRSGERPLLKNGDPRDILARLIELRHPVYESVADIVVDSDSAPPETTLARVIDTLETYVAGTSSHE